MALTEEQRAAKAAAKRERDRAWRARCKARRDIEQVELAQILVELKPSLNRCQEVEYALIEERDKIEALYAERMTALKLEKIQH